MRLAALAALALALVWAVPAIAAGSGTAEADLGRIQTSVKSLEEQLRLVEEGFVARLQSGNDQSLESRFGEAEVAYLIGDYNKATSLLYDVVLTPAFQTNPRYYGGGFYLGGPIFGGGAVGIILVVCLVLFIAGRL